MLPAEIYSAGLRPRGYAIANVFSMGVGFATQYSALPMYRKMHGWVWIFFACCMAFAFTVIFLTYPETKGVCVSFYHDRELTVRSRLRRSRRCSVRVRASASRLHWAGQDRPTQEPRTCHVSHCVYRACVDDSIHFKARNDIEEAESAEDADADAHDKGRADIKASPVVQTVSLRQ